MGFFEDYFKTVCDKTVQVEIESLETICQYFKEASRKHKKAIIVGNGGSAAISSHVSVDLTKNAGIRTINFNEYDLITCFANDYGYEKWVEKSLQFYAESGDVIILISSSGASKNIINAAKKAREMGLIVITFSGFRKNNPLKSFGDLNLWVDSSEYNIVETVHQIWLLALADRLAGKNKN